VIASSRFRLRCKALLVTGVWLSGFVAAASADSSQHIGDAVEVRLGAVLASHQGQAFDQRLISLRRQFDSLFQYSSYSLMGEESRRVKWMREAEFRLPGGRHLVVIPRGYKDGRVSLNLMFMQGVRRLFNTEVALKNNGTLLIGGPSYRDGVLIIAIGARTTH
jgi:hypothetical protein